MTCTCSATSTNRGLLRRQPTLKGARSSFWAHSIPNYQPPLNREDCIVPKHATASCLCCAGTALRALIVHLPHVHSSCAEASPAHALMLQRTAHTQVPLMAEHAAALTPTPAPSLPEPWRDCKVYTHTPNEPSRQNQLLCCKALAVFPLPNRQSHTCPTASLAPVPAITTAGIATAPCQSILGNPKPQTRCTEHDGRMKHASLSA